MAGLGETAIEGVTYLEGGRRVPLNAYDSENAETMKHLDECTAQVDAQLPIAPLSEGDLRSLHTRFTKVLDCLRAQGDDVGATVSLEEFLANSGAPNGISSRFNQLIDDPAFTERFVKCSREFDQGS